MESQTSTTEPFLAPLRGVAEQVRAIVEPVLIDEGCELVALQLVGTGAHPVVRIFADQVGDTKGITLEQLESLNRLVGDVLDVEDGEQSLFSGRYTLEISSPGVERPLTKKSHFQWAQGQEIKVRTIEGEKKQSLQGLVVSTEENGFEIALASSKDGTQDTKFVPWLNIQKANLVFSFDQASNKKPSKGNKKQKNAGAASRAGGIPKKKPKRRQDN